jgi:hypothetical protein
VGGMNITVRLQPDFVGTWLRLLFGSSLPTPKPEGECRWEDDGGVLNVKREGYDHIIGPA